MPKVLTVWMTTNYGKFLKRCKYQISLAASLEICRQIKKQELELDMEQCTRFKLGKEYIKAVYCHEANIYTEHIMSKASLDEAQTRIRIAWRNINNLRYALDTTYMTESEE